MVKIELKDTFQYLIPEIIRTLLYDLSLKYDLIFCCYHHPKKGSSGKCEQLFTKKCDHEYQVQNVNILFT
ncbi:hypothetical protein BpHYR1_049910 [Brachionus plicatilis]|uniref:Uncharacterized protein n=1 Tax=Brachionus plicatilis TaxID=10195 RepID=A0A3M7PK22_BRAPC|nr:hypothetical protein BpHYR1_049910 [Brachionus plicatilis]